MASQQAPLLASTSSGNPPNPQYVKGSSTHGIPPGRPSQTKPNTTENPASTSGAPSTNTPAPSPYVAECALEFLLAGILHFVERECDRTNALAARNGMGATATAGRNRMIDYANANSAASYHEQNDSLSSLSNQPSVSLATTDWRGEGAASNNNQNSLPHSTDYSEEDGTAGDSFAAATEEEAAILSAEMAAGKIERLGFGVGYRLCERLAQGRPLLTIQQSSSNGNNSSNTADDGSGGHLEAVKFLCKEFWVEVFRKQIDKLQTNHRGVFVLKDHDLRWLKRLPADDERARVAAIKLLAFPCGLIRGALSNLGISAVVSCDFLADGKNMAACSFNIKIKT